jgi:hypothetical protein
MPTSRLSFSSESVPISGSPARIDIAVRSPHPAHQRKPLAQRVHALVLPDRLEAEAPGLVDQSVQSLDLRPEHGPHFRVDFGFKPVCHGRARVHDRLAELCLSLEFHGLDVPGFDEAHADLVCKAGYERGVDPVVLGEVPLGPCELPDAQGVRVRDGDVEPVHEGDELELVAARRLHADRRLGLSCEVAELPEPRDVVVEFLRRRAHPFLLRRDEHVELFLGNVDSDVHCV